MEKYIYMVFFVNLPWIERGHASIWVIVDQLTKLAQIIQTKTMLTTHELVDELS